MEEKRQVLHEGELHLGGIAIPCYVLDDGTRVLSGRGMQEALKMVDKDEEWKPTSGARLSRYLDQKSLNDFIYKGKEPGRVNHEKGEGCVQRGIRFRYFKQMHFFGAGEKLQVGRA